MTWMAVLSLTVAWLLSLIIVIAVRGKQLSKQFCILIVVFSSIGAGAVQYFLFSGIQRTERFSAAHLVAASSLRLKYYGNFIREHMSEMIANSKVEPKDASQIDWGGTFQLTAQDISATIAGVERSALVRTSYSIWMGDIEFKRGQMDRMADAIVKTDERSPRQSSIEAYLVLLDSSANQLDRLSLEMLSRPPSAYYER